jgi:hypothetical protein
VDVAPVRDLGALHVHKGRLWLGVPRGVRKEVPGLKWTGIWLAPDGIHDYGGGGLIAKRRVRWEQMTSVVVRLGPWQSGVPLTMPLVPTDRLKPDPSSDKPPEVVVAEWVGRTRFDRNLAGGFTGWVGDDSPAIRHAVEQLPDALRRRPTMRGALVSDEWASKLLGRLAAAPDVEAVDALLRS